MPRTVIFDFDGTIALGDGPVDAYARGVVEASPIPGLARAIANARDTLARQPGAYRDGYDAVAATALAMGVDSEALSTAYLRSRHALATADAPVTAAPGLAQFLGTLARSAQLVLVTNAPDIRVSEALEVLGVARFFERRVCSAKKPAGIAAEVTAALTHGPVLSVGDIDEFDLAPARALGADTALVGPAASAHGHLATFAATRLEQLYGDIQMWAAATAPINDASTGA